MPCHTHSIQQRQTRDTPVITFPSRLLIHVLATSDLSSLNRTHLVDPSWGRLNLTNGTNLITGVAGDADVVTTLKSKLDIANFKCLGPAFLGVPTSCLNDIIDKLIRDGEDGLLVCYYCFSLTNVEGQHRVEKEAEARITSVESGNGIQIPKASA